MNDDDSGSRSKRKTPQSPPREPPESRLALIDWDKIRAMAYKITAQVKAVKEVERSVGQQLLAMAESEWEGIKVPQDVAVGLMLIIATQYPIESLEGSGVRQSIFSITHRVSSFDDITQVVKYKLLRMGPGDWDRVESPESYLNTMVQNAAVDWWRRENAQQWTVSERLRTTNPDNDPGDVAIRAFAGRDAEFHLKDLAPRVREAFVRREAWGYSVKEIAAQMRVAEETVKGYLAAAVDVLSGLEGYIGPEGRRRGLKKLFKPKEDK